jgi:hypothetical protein
VAGRNSSTNRVRDEYVRADGEQRRERRSSARTLVVCVIAVEYQEGTVRAAKDSDDAASTAVGRVESDSSI